MNSGPNFDVAHEPKVEASEIVRLLVLADIEIIDKERELVEPLRSDDFDTRAKYARDLAYLAGVRNGLAIARNILDDVSDITKEGNA